MTLIPAEPPSEFGGISSLRLVSLFSGVGGLDHGLEVAGHQIVEMCENWEPARRVLAQRFPGIPVAADVRDFHSNQPYDLLTAGFPCVDISHAGRQQGIFGPGSGLVEHAFRVIKEDQPMWVVLENVPNILRLGKGAGIAHVLDSLMELGYSWAYRVVDSRAFGVAQSRRRVIILASRSESPAARLFADEAPTGEPEQYTGASPAESWGFYWTEGRRGVGLVEGAIPTLKGGSTLGLPSAPAIWNPAAAVGRRIALPTVEDGEELQGFQRGWTAAATVAGEPNHRWKLVGNAVTVGVATWLGRCLARANAPQWQPAEIRALDRLRPWPDAAWGSAEGEWAADASRWPVRELIKPLSEVVAKSELTPLSRRATAGFMSRLAESGLGIDPRLTADLASHLEIMSSILLPSRDGKGGHSSVAQGTRRKPQPLSQLERDLRRSLTVLGLKYRLSVRPEKDIEWVADIMFLGAKVAVEIQSCSTPSCDQHPAASPKKTNSIPADSATSRENDDQMVSRLTGRGWLVIVVREHEPIDVAAAHIAESVQLRRVRQLKLVDQRHD